MQPGWGPHASAAGAAQAGAAGVSMHGQARTRSALACTSGY